MTTKCSVRIAMFTLRFDMRAPEWAGPAADLYAAAIDMCAWAETRALFWRCFPSTTAPTTGICLHR